MEAEPRPAELDRDCELLKALAAGDEAVLGELYDRHIAAMFRTARALLGNRADAEDLLHDVFVEVRSRARQYDASRGTVRSWLLVRVRSRALDRLRSLHLRRAHAARAAALTSIEERSSPADWGAADHRRVAAAVAELPIEQRTLIELAYFEGLTHAEMSSRCDVPIGTVKSRLTAAMAKLRRRLVDGCERTDASAGATR